MSYSDAVKVQLCDKLHCKGDETGCNLTDCKDSRWVPISMKHFQAMFKRKRPLPTRLLVCPTPLKEAEPTP